MSTLFTQRAVLLHGIGGIILATALLGCAGREPSQAVSDTQPPVAQTPVPPPATAPAPFTSDLWTTTLVDLEGSAKQGIWNKSATLDDGFCTIKAHMSIVFNTDASPDDSNANTGSFDIWVCTTDASTKPQLHQSFEVLDASGKSLFKLGPFGGFEIPSSVNYHHWIGYFTYPKSSYPQIAKVCRLPSTCKQ